MVGIWDLGFYFFVWAGKGCDGVFLIFIIVLMLL